MLKGRVMTLTVQDVFAMFEPFGIASKKVNATLDACDDRRAAYNSFEGMKTLVQLRWDEMVAGDVSQETLDKLRPTYERLMKISLKNYTPRPIETEADKKLGRDIVSDLMKGNIDGIMETMEEVKRERVKKFSDAFRQVMKDKK